jgi:hypothetical protein
MPALASEFLTNLCAEVVDELAGIWQLEKPLVYRSVVMDRTITVPAGFKTDFASVPRILGIYDLEGGKCNKAATVHDLLYTLGSAGRMAVDRATADAVLREAILASGYGRTTAALFYAAVRSFGGSHWKAPNLPQQPHVDAVLNLAA